MDSGDGSVAAQCRRCARLWFCDDLTIDETQQAHLVDIQKQPIKSCGKRNIPLLIEGYRQEVPSLIDFDFADVACPVLSLERHIAKGYMFLFG